MTTEKTRVVLAGCGGISRVWMEAVKSREDVEIVGLVDIREESARKLAEDCGLGSAAVGVELGAVLKSTQPQVVFDCSLPETHTSVTLEALAHGCHVLGEKPMADTLANAQKMVAAARQAGRIYAVIQNRRYDPNIRALRAFLASDAIGAVTTVHSDFFIGAHFGGFRDRMEHVLLLDMAIHTFDAARFIMGEDAVSVYCHEWNPAGSWYDYDASAVALFQMTNGVVYTYRGSWCSEGRNTTWEAGWHIIGEKGSVTWDGAGEFRAQTVSGKEGFIRPLTDVAVPAVGGGGTRGGHAGVIDEFLNCVRAGGTPETVCTDNIKSLAMVHAAVESAKKGRKVSIEEIGITGEKS